MGGYSRNWEHVVKFIFFVCFFNNLYFTMKHDSKNKKSIALYSKKIQ